MKKNQIEEQFEEKILDVEYSDVMKKSYIDYAMSVIIARALPDIRDGLKPVQRRIIYDMKELGIFSDKPYRKSARITGDTMGKYHPHGDSSIYDAMVVMAQDFKKGIKLIDGHGNFGSIEGDGAAAMRYTEAKLEKFTENVFLSNLDYNVVDFIPNYDETEKEPSVLPCTIPNFLINGAEGIAVGMATSVPPHNLSEVIDSVIYYMDNKDATTKDLLDILKGPDFPTGGIVSNASDLLQIYETGVGKIKVRGKVGFEQGKGSEKDKLIVTEIPYTMIGEGISKFLQSVADLVENKTLPEIVDITNQTSNDGIRIVFELKKGSDYEYIKNILYKKTRLEDTFGVNMLAVCDGKPEIMGIKRIFKEFIDFQYEINTKKYQNLLEKTKKRIEVLDGLIKATDIIDLIIEILRGSKSIKQAKECITLGKTDGIKFKSKTSEKSASKLSFSEIQADAILAMNLSRLVGLEIESLEKELNNKQKLAAKYEKLLGNKTEMKKEIKKDLELIKSEFGYDRKTIITDSKPIDIVEREEEEVDIVILIDKFYYIHSIDASVYEKNKETINSEYKMVVRTTNKAKLALFCDSGKAHILKCQEIPYGKMRDKGQPIDNVCNYDSKCENIVGYAATKPNAKYIFTSSNGFIKVVDMSEFDVTRKTIDASKFKDNATLVSVIPYDENGFVVLSTKNGMFIKFKQSEIPEQKKNAVGSIAIKLNNDVLEKIYNLQNQNIIVKDNERELDFSKVKLMHRGGKGTKTRF